MRDGGRTDAHENGKRGEGGSKTKRTRDENKEGKGRKRARKRKSETGAQTGETKGGCAQNQEGEEAKRVSR